MDREKYQIKVLRLVHVELSFQRNSFFPMNNFDDKIITVWTETFLNDVD